MWAELDSGPDTVSEKFHKNEITRTHRHIKKASAAAFLITKPLDDFLTLMMPRDRIRFHFAITHAPKSSLPKNVNLAAGTPTCQSPPLPSSFLLFFPFFQSKNSFTQVKRCDQSYEEKRNGEEHTHTHIHTQRYKWTTDLKAQNTISIRPQNRPKVFCIVPVMGK